MEFKVKHIAYAVGGLGAAYLVYSLLNKGFSFAAKYPRLYALVTKGESKTYNDYNFYNVTGLKGNLDGKGSKYPFPSPAYCDGTLSKYPNKRIKLYDDKTASVETKNWNHNDFRKNVKQEGKWKTDSLGNPIIYNLGPEEMMTIN